MIRPDPLAVLVEAIEPRLFSSGRIPVPNLDDVYELQLAFYENLILSDEELLRNAGYFSRVNSDYTRHFLMCVGEPLKLPEHSSSRLKSFFEKNIFRTGYATHGLFPYRGKFHPQMVKGLLNAMGLKPGQTVLDPMMGSGTVAVEASLMGIHSVGLDASPFCRFMAQTKIDTLTMTLARAKGALTNYEEVFRYFQKRVGKPTPGSKARTKKSGGDFMAVMESGAEYTASGVRDGLSPDEQETADTYAFLLLAYLDSAGYSERSSRRPPLEQFRAILERYLFVAEKIQHVLHGVESELGAARLMEGDARTLPLADGSVDGIIFSPPYSFAIDYLDNDSFHLNYLGVDTETLRQKMIGLRGRRLDEKYEIYQADMNQILSECARVLRPGQICTVIVGTNSNQLAKALDVLPEQVRGLHEVLTELGQKNGLGLVKMLSRPITGMSNTMRREYILMMVRQ